MNQTDSRVAPHPVLSDYYGSECVRRERVDRMFDASAEHYDWINSVMSFGTGEWYRRDALKRIGIQPGMMVLDAGTGTGVVAAIEQELVGVDGLVVALVCLARRKSAAFGTSRRAWVRLFRLGLTSLIASP